MLSIDFLRCWRVFKCNFLASGRSHANLSKKCIIQTMNCKVFSCSPTSLMTSLLNLRESPFYFVFRYIPYNLAVYVNLCMCFCVYVNMFLIQFTVYALLVSFCFNFTFSRNIWNIKCVAFDSFICLFQESIRWSYIHLQLEPKRNTKKH